MRCSFLKRHLDGIDKKMVSYNESYYLMRGISLELKAEIKDLLTLMKPRKSDRILEIGCGGGDFLRRIERGRGKVVGIDHSLEAVRLARSRVARAYLLVGSTPKLSFRDSVFDKIVFIEGNEVNF